MEDTQSPPQPPPGDFYRSPVAPVQHLFSFTGSALEYFSIWIVNVALTIITLGFYSPWAKVRRERYLTSHTELAGSQFEYTADPWKIFKGRLLLLVVFIAIGVAQAIPALWALVVLPLFVLGWPWILVAALRFRARYTSYRNLPFHFSGTPGDAFMRCVLPRWLAFMTLWLLAPWAQCVAKRYTINNLHYGITPVRSSVTAGQLYRVYAVGILMFIVGAGLMGIGVVILGLDPEAMRRGELSSLSSAPRLLLGGLITSVGFGAIVGTPGYIRLGIARHVWDGATLGDCIVSWAPSVKRYLFIVVSNTIARSLTLGLATPWCVIRTRRFLVDGLVLTGPADLDDFVGQRRDEVRSLGEQAAEAYDLDIDFGF